MFHQDLPIEKSEKDIFNRSNYAKNLAEALLKSQYKSSFVVGLYGEWGSGKTSLCNMILEKIRGETEKHDEDNSHIVAQTINSEKSIKDEQVVIFQFNPWLCSDATQLINQFFIQLGATLQIKNKNLASIAKSIFNYAEIISNLSSPFIPISGYISKICSWAKEKCSKNEKQKKTIQNIKNDIIKELKQQNIKLFITIDDIDRLSEQETVAVFQLVKALGDFPNTIYFLCFDYEIVTTALDNMHTNKGKEYLEKIVQLPVSMPKFKFIHLKNEFEMLLMGIISETDKSKIENKENLQRWLDCEFAIMPYIKSIRDIHRLFNTYSLVYKQLHEETDFFDLLGITCLQVFEPILYSDLYLFKDSLFNNMGKDYRTLLNSLCTDLSNTNNINDAQILLEKLFEKINSSSSSDIEMNRIDKRICDKGAFDRYFTYALFETDISKVTIQNILYYADEIEQNNVLESLIKKNNFSEVIEEFLAYFADRNRIFLDQQLQYLFNNLVLLWKKIVTISPSIKGKYEYLIGAIADKFDHNKLYSLLKDLVANREISVLLVAQIVGQKFKYRIKDNKIEFLDTKEIEIMNCLMDRIEKLLQDKEGDDFFSKDLTFDIKFMQLLKKINSEQANTILKKLFADLSFYTTFINSLLFSSGENNLKVFSVKGDFKEFIDCSTFINQTNNFIVERKFLDYDEELQLRIVAFKLLIDRYKSKPIDEIETYMKYDEVKSELEKIKKNLEQS